jgi:glycosyltransferase involved in cell wall biosynthesis
VAFTSFGLSYARRRAGARSLAEAQDIHMWAGQRFCELVLTYGLPDAAGVYAFNSAALELLQEVHRRGGRAILEQTIAPHRILADILRSEHATYPDWEPDLMAPFHAATAERERQEWSSADLILCGSDFVAKGIAACNGPEDRCVVIPYGVDVPVPEARSTQNPAGPLRVLTVGEVGLRKGSPYVLAAARIMKDGAIFRMVGAIGVREAVQAELQAHVELVGPVSRADMPAMYAWADVFLLPSLCEGSATVTYEALAHGLPVICTANTGSVIRDGEDGFIVPIRDASAIVDRLTRLCDPTVRMAMGEWARRRAAEFTEAAYGRQLLKMLAAR